MKNILKVIFAMLVMAITPVNSFGVLTPPDNLSMLADREALWAYAVSQVRSIHVWMYSPSTVNNSDGYRYESFKERLNTEELAGRLSANTVKLEVANPADSVSAGYYMLDKNGQTMLYASKSMTPTKVGDHWQLPQDSNIFDPMLSHDSWIDVPNARQARIIELDENGKTKHVEYLYSGNGNGFYFPSITAGLTNAIIIVEFWDEKTGEQTSRAYKIGGPGGGSMITTQNFFVSPNSGLDKAFKHYLDPKLPSYVGGAVPVFGGSGNNPIYEVVLTGDKTKNVAFSAYTVEHSSLPAGSPSSETKWAIGFKIIAIDVSGEIYQFDIENDSHLLVLRLNPGTYYVYPVWREGDFYPTQPPYLPYKTWLDGKG